jgi:hypothetical protein
MSGMRMRMDLREIGLGGVDCNLTNSMEQSFS